MARSPPLASGRSLPPPPRERRSSPRIEPRVSSYFSAVSSRYLASPPRPQPATVSAIASVSQRAAAAFVPKVAPKAVRFMTSASLLLRPAAAPLSGQAARQGCRPCRYHRAHRRAKGNGREKKGKAARRRRQPCHRKQKERHPQVPPLSCDVSC